MCYCKNKDISNLEWNKSDLYGSTNESNYICLCILTNFLPAFVPLPKNSDEIDVQNYFKQLSDSEIDTDSDVDSDSSTD